jgi:hypothetical protein
LQQQALQAAAWHQFISQAALVLEVPRQTGANKQQQQQQTVAASWAASQHASCL